MCFRKNASAFRGRRLRHLLALATVLSLVHTVNGPEAAVMTVRVTDSTGVTQVPARCCVIDSLGQSRYPYIYTSLYHTFGDGYFYTSGQFGMNVPDGPTIVRVARGPEFCPVEDTILVRGDTTLTVRMERLVDMRAAGWFSGDTHIHLDHSGGFFHLDPSDAVFMGRAEDLQFVNCLDNAFHFTGFPDPASTADCVVYMSEELRSFVYGHCTLPGMRRLILPYDTTWDDMLMDIADSVHAQDGPLMICAHPACSEDFGHIEEWPGSGLPRELPIDVIYGKVDAFDLMSYSNRGDGTARGLWYALLDCGFRIPPTAGTDAAVNQLASAPMGGFRVYVRHDGGVPDIYQWLDGIASGRTFVTNGPLFTRFEAEEAGGAGDSATVSGSGYTVTVHVTVECAFPLERVDVIVNGRSVDSMSPRGSLRNTISERSVFHIYESCWVAAVARGPAGQWAVTGERLFAHTAPVYFRVDGRPVRKSSAAEYFTCWIDSVTALAEAKGEWGSSGDSLRTFAELSAARDWYASRVDPPTGTGEGAGPATPRAPKISVYPNPFSDRVEITIEGVTAAAEDGVMPGRARNPVSTGRLVVYDVTGRIVRRLETSGDGGMLSAIWDGRNDSGNSCASGIYFCRFEAGPPAVQAKMLLIR